jgi:hypothetical protein
MKRVRAKGRTWLSVFAIPLGLAVAGSFGFAAAFLFGDVGRYLSWLGLGLPVIAIACAGVYGIFPQATGALWSRGRAAVD